MRCERISEKYSEVEIEKSYADIGYTLKKGIYQSYIDSLPNIYNDDDKHTKLVDFYNQFVIDQLAKDATALIGGKKDSRLIIYESAIPKKGIKSIRVARQ